MSAPPLSKAAQLARIEAARAGWEALLADVGDERMTRPGAAGDWTFSEAVAHLNAWRELTLERLAAANRGETPRLPWPAGMGEETPEGVQEINAWMTERDRDRPAAAVVAESREQFRRMRAAVAALPEADLLEPGRFPWLDGLPLSAVLDGSFEHLQEHEAMIRAWLAADPAPRPPSAP